jgi:hypothetical protein
MTLTLAETTERLAALTRGSLQGAELIEFKFKDESADERRYVVRWSKNTAEAGGFQEYGTHVACLHDDGRSMLVWGHYTRNEREAKRDYKERA